MKLGLKILGVIVLFSVLGGFNLVMNASRNPSGNPSRNYTAGAETFLIEGVQKEMTQAVSSQVVTDFSNFEQERDRWRGVDDTVMGGVSQGDFAVTEQGIGLFSGVLSLENNGGFSSVRRASDDVDFSAASGLSLRVRGDGRRYQLRLQTADAEGISYRSEFETTADEWQIVQVPFDSFEPVFRGRIVADAPPLNSAAIEQVGFLIADQKSGAFELEVDWIQSDGLQ